MFKRNLVSLVRCIIILNLFLFQTAHGDVLSSSTQTLIDAQYNNSSWSAANLLDTDPNTRWLSSKQTNDLNFQLNNTGEAICLGGFDLTNYGNDDRSVKQFVLLTTSDVSLAADASTLGWRPIIADASPTGLIDYLSWAQGARMVSVDSQYNSTSWGAKHINDGSAVSRWLSSKSNNVIEFNFDIDWSGVTGDKIPINEIEVINYGADDRSVKEFQVEVTTDGITWSKLEVPSTAAGDTDFIYSRSHDGAILGVIDSQYNSTSWGADNLHDGDANTRWLSSKGNNSIEFTFDPNNNGITGANGDAADVFTIDKIKLENYGNDDRSVNEFQVAVKTLANNTWQKITVPASIIGQADYNFALSHHGGELVSIDSEYNTTSWGADNIHDGDNNTRWLSSKGNNTLAFQFDVDENGTKASAADLFTMKSFYLKNYGNDDRSIKEFQVEVKTTSTPSWQKLNVPGSTSGEAGYNFLLSHHGGKLIYIDSEYNATSWGADNIHDGDLNTRWLSSKGNNTLDFQFDLDADGSNSNAADLFTMESFQLVNYGNDDRSIKEFQVEVKTLTNTNWTKIPVSGSALNDPGYNFSLIANGGSLTTIDTQYNTTSWGAKNIHDGDPNTRWLSSKQDNTVAFEFDTDNNGVSGDVINLDTVSLTNYGNDDRSVQTFEIDIQISGGAWQAVNAPAGGTIFTANMNNTVQNWSIGPFNNVTATRIRTLSNYGDPSYTGAAELTFSGDSVGPSYTYSAAMHGNGETFLIDGAQQPIDVTDVRIRTINNHGDPSYIGAIEFKALGVSVARNKTFVAAMNGTGETFTLDLADIQTDVTDVRLVTISNHGDPSYIGAAEFKVQGPSITRTKTFTAAMNGTGELFQLELADKPIDVTDVKLITINNHGDPSYIGIQEFEVMGVSVTPGHTFNLAMTASPQTIALDSEDVVSDIIGARIVTIKNHGDPSYTGMAEFSLKGTAITPSYVFEAQMNSAIQNFTFPNVSANTFRFHSLNNHGDPSYIGAADFALTTGICALAQWRMDEANWTGADNEVKDESNSGNDGKTLGYSVGNGPLASSLNPAIGIETGTCGYGSFDGIDDYISINNGENLDNISELTVTAWIKADSFVQTNGTDARGVFSKGHTGSNVSYGAFFDTSGTNRLNIDIVGSDDRFLSNTVFNINTWYHIAIVFDGSQIESQRVKLYVNGVLDGTFSESSSVIPDTNEDFYIGNYYSDNNILKVFDGAIDEVNIKASALQVSEVIALKNAVRSCTPAIHHFQIEHDGAGLTCASETLTVKACTNAACSSVLSSDIDFTLSATGAASTWSQNPLTITGGSLNGVNVNLTHTTAELISLSGTSTPAAANPVTCIPSCDLTFHNSGYIVTLADHTSCTTASLSIKAVKLGDTGVSCAPAYTGVQSVDLVFNYLNPSSGTKVPTLATSNMAKSGVTQNRSITFDETGTASLDFDYEDAGQIRIDVSDAAGMGITAASVTSVVKPAKLFFDFNDVNAACISNDENCSVHKAAGEAFIMDVNASCSDNTVTPNFEMNNIPLTVSTVAPNLGNPVVLGVSNMNFVEADSGIHSITNQSISEVGVFTITATPTVNGYFGLTIPAATSASVGRFTPKYFDLTIIEEGVLGSGNSFVYTGQMDSVTPSKGKVSYITAPKFTITAKSHTANTTLNYTGSFLKMQTDDINRVVPSTDSLQLGSDGVNKVNLTASLNSVILSESNGVITYEYHANDNFFYTRDTNAVVAPYIADIDFKITDIIDDDDIAAKDIDNDNSNGVLTLNPAAMEVRFGRWSISNNYGPETAPLIMPMAVQYFDGTQFIVNTADGFTAFDGAKDGNVTDISLAPANTSVSGSGLFVGGETYSVKLASPGIDKKGSVELGFSVPSWLKYDWDNDGQFDNDPSANGTFGNYRGNDRVIYWREIGN